jgi:hypothetical protein
MPTSQILMTMKKGTIAERKFNADCLGLVATTFQLDSTLAVPKRKLLSDHVTKWSQ